MSAMHAFRTIEREEELTLVVEVQEGRKAGGGARGRCAVTEEE